MKKEMNYEFHKKLLEVHPKNILNPDAVKKDGEFEIQSGASVFIPNDASDVIITAARDFQDYLFDALGVSVIIKKGASASSGDIALRLSDKKEDLGDGDGYMGYRLTVSESVEIIAHDDRGAAQAFYALEDFMTIRKAPYLECGVWERKAMFSPRMIHSGYAVDKYPNEHLSAIAHAGMDAILVFVKGVNMTPSGFLDFNELVYRAAKYGLDVYAYSYIKSELHPKDKGANEYYDGIYGKLFEACPGLRGIVFVGESVAFPSKDKNTTGTISMGTEDGIPQTKIHPGWWPCEDYPEWMVMIRDTIRAYKKDADIVLWSYNWGWAPLEYRERIIRTMPKDISLLVTFEMEEQYEDDGATEMTVDYTLSRVGPGDYFLSEAKIAKEEGIRLYSMTNTGGLTWDFGTIPYEPFPYQWQSRHDKIIEAKEKYGLCGLMESHHYGFYPSFISEICKWNFTDDKNKPKDMMKKIFASHFGEENADSVDEAMKKWSEGINHYHTTDSDQYGPFRIGPAYPLNFSKKLVPPSAPYAHFGARILNVEYSAFEYEMFSHTGAPPIEIRMSRLHSIPQVGIFHQLKHLVIMREKMNEGLDILMKIENKNDELLSLVNLGRYITANLTTGINTKKFNITRAQMVAETDLDIIEKKLDELEQIARDEIKNAEDSIEIVEADSRLGWEPSMEYLGDAEHIRWKIRQVKYMLASDIAAFRAGLTFNGKGLDYDFNKLML